MTREAAQAVQGNGGTLAYRVLSESTYAEPSMTIEREMQPGFVDELSLSYDLTGGGGHDLGRFTWTDCGPGIGLNVEFHAAGDEWAALGKVRGFWEMLAALDEVTGDGPAPGVATVRTALAGLGFTDQTPRQRGD